MNTQEEKNQKINTVVKEYRLDILDVVQMTDEELDRLYYRLGPDGETILTIEESGM